MTPFQFFFHFASGNILVFCDCLSIDDKSYNFLIGKKNWCIHLDFIVNGIFSIHPIRIKLLLDWPKENRAMIKGKFSRFDFIRSVFSLSFSFLFFPCFFFQFVDHFLSFCLVFNNSFSNIYIQWYLLWWTSMK